MSNCGDSILLYQLEKQYRRLGTPISRSTITDLFHRHAKLLAPLTARLLLRVRQSELVFRDETSIKMLGSTKRLRSDFHRQQSHAYRFRRRSQRRDAAANARWHARHAWRRRLHRRQQGHAGRGSPTAPAASLTLAASSLLLLKAFAALSPSAKTPHLDLARTRKAARGTDCVTWQEPP